MKSARSPWRHPKRPLPPKGTRVFWPHIVLGLIGLALSFYAVHAHLQIEAGQATGCSINETISCDDVIGSKYGKFAGIPLGYFGAAFWIIVIISGHFERRDLAQKRALASAGRGGGWIGDFDCAGVYRAFRVGQNLPDLQRHAWDGAVINFIYATVGLV